MIKNIVKTLLVLIPFSFFSQKNIEIKPSLDIIIEGVNLHDEEKYEDAIELYQKVAVNDTNYSLAQFETSLSYFAMEDYKNAIKTIEDLLALELVYPEKNILYTMLGSSYDESGDLEKAIESYNRGIELFPMSYKLYYNRALVYTKLEKHKEAIEDYKKAISCKPDHLSSHYNLGKYALNEGHYTEAMLSFITYLMMDPTSERANYVIQMMENASNGEIELESENFFWDEKENYDQLNIFFKNKVALEKNYKVKLTIDRDYGKQLHFLLSNLKYDEKNTGFWNQTYLPFLKGIFEAGRFDDMIMFSLQSSGNSKTQSKLRSKKSKLISFRDFAIGQWNSHVNYKYIDFEGQFQLVYINYEDEGLSSLGIVKDNNAVGNWYYYFSNGALNMTGTFSDEGKQIGNWKIYNMYNGKLSNEISFEDGKREGEQLLYYFSGELNKKFTNKDGLAEDTVYYYYRSGDVSEKFAMYNGEKNGDIFGYHENGQLNYHYTLKDGIAEGKYLSYFPTGVLAFDFDLKNDKRNGKYISYHENGKKKIEQNIIDGELDGESKSWYVNGQLESVSSYKEGKMVGDYVTYFSNGKISAKSTFDESGKENGTSEDFDLDGVKFHERTFKKGELISVKSFNKKGEVIFESTKKNKKIEYKYFYPDGVLKVEGRYLNDLRDGEWKFYSRYGNLTGIENYKEGDLTDTSKYFYNNGQLKAIEVYEDGEINGLYLKYNIFGELILEGIFKNGDWDRECYEYDDFGDISTEYFYVDGELNGILKEYAVNGKLISWKNFEYGKEISNNFLDTNEVVIDTKPEFHGNVKLHDYLNKYISYEANCKNGVNDGKTAWYFPDGSVSTVGYFSNDKKNGVWKRFYMNGKPYYEENYVNGNKEGKQVYYFDNSTIKSTEFFINGSKEGEEINYYSSGKKSSVMNYFEDELHGKCVYYNLEGEIYLIRYYDNGVFKSYSYIGKDGKEVEPIPLKIGENKIVTYYPNGKIASEHVRNNGLIEGDFIVYFTNGKIQSKEGYKFGDLHGESIFYYENGNVSLKYNCKYDNYVDEMFEYYESGQIETSSVYVKDKKHGIEKQYSKEGKLIKEIEYYNDEIIGIKKH